MRETDVHHWLSKYADKRRTNSTRIVRVSGVREQLPLLTWCAESELTLDLTHTFDNLCIIEDIVAAYELPVVCDDIIVNATISRLLPLYSMWQTRDLRKIAEAHRLRLLQRETAATLFDKLLQHTCGRACSHSIVWFTTRRSGVRTQEQIGRARALPRAACPTSPSSFLPVVDETLRRFILEDWQRTMTTEKLRLLPCAVCARRTPSADISVVDPGSFDLSLLRNDALADAVLPTTYAFETYQCALLYPKGMSDPWTIAPLNMCCACESDLIRRSKMPRLCLANWLYYGLDELPPSVSDALSASTHVDKLLIARARTSRISFRFKQTASGFPGDADEPHPTDERQPVPQKYVRGNVLVMPQNSTQLNNILPPPPSVIHDTVCAVFVGRSKPTPETVRKVKVLLARKSVVKTLIEFLVDKNPYYTVDDETFFGLSQANLNALFPAESEDTDSGIPSAMGIGFLGESEAINASTADYTTRNIDEDAPPDTESLLMENVGYTSGDESPVSYRDMKMRALSHCLNQGRFVCSKAGDKFVPDFQNPALLTWLFPHLDPWGIGGFHHPSRTRPVSMEQQLRYLLERDEGLFQADPDFAFVYFNILQKKSVCDSVRFRVKESQQRRIVTSLLALDRTLLQKTMKRFERDPTYSPSTSEEADMLALIDSVSTVLPNIPGTTGYKLSLRNEIRALVNFQGTPAFFVTLNPSDVHHPLVRLFAGEDIQLDDVGVGEELSAWQRKLVVAKNPAACAKFFHAMISTFINIVLRFGKPEKGLLGKCTAYYGTVEAQARGSLHCHMLIWIDGHPSPQKMRDMMQSSDEYKTHVFAWLESIIKSELLGTTEVVSEPNGRPLPRPPFREGPGNVHAGARPQPSVAELSPDDFKQQYMSFVNELVQRYNWHEHTETCWKYLRSNQTRSDENCRMRINGVTRTETVVDTETLSIQLRRLHPRIANYNDLVTFVLQANMDIKHIGSGEGAKALIYYVTDYITKSSLPTHLGLAALMYAITSTNARYGPVEQWSDAQDTGALTILVNSLLSRQEISHAQVMSYLVGGGDHYTGHKFRLLYFRAFERLVRRYWGELQTAVPIEAASSALSQHESPASNDNHERPQTPALNSRDLEQAQERRVETAMDVEEERESSATLDEDVSHMERTDINVLTSAEPEGTSSGEGEESVTLSLANGSISALNQQQDYMLRPETEPFDNMCLYEFVGLTEKITRACESQSRRTASSEDSGRPARGRPREDRGQFMATHPDYGTHLVRKRVVWVVPVILGRRIARSDRSDEEREDWARTILVLFLPWRTAADLKEPDELWIDSYTRHERHIPRQHRTIIANMNVLNQCRDARDRVRQESRAAPRMEGNESRTGDLPHAHEDHEGPDNEEEYPDPFSLAPPDPDPSTTSPRSPLEVLTDLISLPARIALDRCFTRPVSQPEDGGVGSATKVTGAQGTTLQAEHTYMRMLKRKRRPETAPTGVTEVATFRARNATQAATMSFMSLAPLNGNSADNLARTLGHNPTAEDLQAVTDEVIAEYNLHSNSEQLRAFEIVARHVCFHGPQLSMYVGGVGGTGKSYVVQAILRLFTLLGRRNEILVSAPTGAAAVLIGGYTIHSLLLLPNEENPDLQALAVIWENVLYLIIDEISMVSANLLCSISSRLQHAKGQFAVAEDRPFGGVNVIFLGDFGQLRPVISPALYSHRYISEPTVQDAQHKATLAAFKGVYLWRSVRTVVILQKNQRQSKDAPYSNLLSRVREGRSGDARYAGSAYDFRTLQKRLIQNFDRAACYRFVDAPVIVDRKVVRDALNRRLLQLHADSIGADVEVYYAVDKVEGRVLSGNARDTVWDLGSSTTRDSLGRLPLFPGMRVMVQENIAFAYHVVNGAVGTVKDIKYEDHRGYRTVSVVYVEIPGAGRLLGQAEDIVPIFPNSTYFTWTRRRATKTVPADADSVSRLQPPLLPAYAYTDYKAQGRSLDNAIVDLDSCFSLQGAYVMLSRVRTSDGLAILRPFKPRKVEAELSAELREEFSSLQELDDATASTWRQQQAARPV